MRCIRVGNPKSVVPDDYFGHSQIAVFEPHMDAACIGVESVPDQFGDGLDRRCLRLPLEEVRLDFDRVAVLSHCLQTLDGSPAGTRAVQECTHRSSWPGTVRRSAHRVLETPGRLERHRRRGRYRDGSPVRGFRPMRSVLAEVTNVPIPQIVTFSPRGRASVISENIMSTTAYAASAVTNASAEMRFTRSDLLT